MITVAKVEAEEGLKTVFNIREQVFVNEQEVSPEEEYDEFEDISTHFLARVDGIPAGTARWRPTAKGIKLERFAVLKPYRRLGVGQALVKGVLEDIALQKSHVAQFLYLHAQLPAVSLYEKFGFKTEGKTFIECGIVHYSMKKHL